MILYWCSRCKRHCMHASKPPDMFEMCGLERVCRWLKDIEKEQKMIIIKLQDKEEIRKVDNLWIHNKKDTTFRIMSNIEHFTIVLATYPTKERAQEVINEIWQCMKWYQDERPTSIPMYEMPKE